MREGAFWKVTMAVVVRTLYVRGRTLVAPLQRAAEAVVRVIGARTHDLEVVLVDARFTREFRRTAKERKRTDLLKPLHKDGFNVLSFPSEKPLPGMRGARAMGEVFLCPPYIKKHGEDMLFLLIHGILHLQGYDHVRKRDRIVMEARERTLYATVLRLRIPKISLLLPPWVGRIK